MKKTNYLKCIGLVMCLVVLSFSKISASAETYYSIFDICEGNDRVDYLDHRESGPEIDKYTTEQLVSESGEIFMKREDNVYTLYGSGTIKESVISDYFEYIDYKCNEISKFTISSDSLIKIECSESKRMFGLVGTSGRYHRRYYWSYGKKIGDPVIHKTIAIERGFTPEADIVIKNVEFSSAKGLFGGCESISSLVLDNVSFIDSDAEGMFYHSDLKEIDLTGVNSNLVFNNSFDNSECTVKLNRDADTSNLYWGEIKVLDASNVDKVYIPANDKGNSWVSNEGDVYHSGEEVSGDKIYTNLGYTGRKITLSYSTPVGKKRIANDEDDRPRYKDIYDFILSIDGADLNKKYEVPDVSKAGYTFSGTSTSKYSSQSLDEYIKISKDGDKYYLQLVKPIEEDMNFYLMYSGNTYVLTIVDTVDNDSISYKVKPDIAYKLIIPKHEGYELSGLFTSDNKEVEIDYAGYLGRGFYDSINYPFTKDETFYFKYNPIKYKIKYMNKVGDSFQFYSWSPEKRPYTVDSEYELLVPDKKGYTYKGWFLDEAMTKKVERLEKNDPGDKVLYTEIIPKTVNVQFNLNGGVSNGTYPSTMTYDSNVTFEEPTKDGYAFDGWYTDESYEAKYKVRDTWTFDEDCTVYARWLTNESCTHENMEIRGRKEATCKEEGYSGDIYCTDCGKLVTVGNVVDKLTTHGNVEVYGYKQATCKEEGYTGDKYCLVCREILEQGSVIEKTPHNWGERHIITPATSTTDGECKYTCSICGMEKTAVIPMSGCTHETTITKNYKPSTCKDQGYSGDIYCADCNELVEEGEVTEKSSTHGKSELRNVKEVSDIENGYSGDLYCTICNTLLMEGYTIQTIKPVVTTESNSIMLQSYSLASDTITLYREDNKADEYNAIKTMANSDSIVKKVQPRKNKLVVKLKNSDSEVVKIRYSRKKDLSNCKIVKTKKNKCSLSRLKKGTYYLQFKKGNGEWSNIEKVKVK